MNEQRYSFADALVSLGHDAKPIRDAADEFYAPRRFGLHLVERGLISHEDIALGLVQQRALNRESTPLDYDVIRRLLTESSERRAAGIAALWDSVQA